jgi:hypothetical protein
LLGENNRRNRFGETIKAYLKSWPVPAPGRKNFSVIYPAARKNTRLHKDCRLGFPYVYSTSGPQQYLRFTFREREEALKRMGD